jgi:hypothetical protein
MSREVPAKVYAFTRAMAIRHGADVEAAARGLGLACIDPDTPGLRVDWDDPRGDGGSPGKPDKTEGQPWRRVQRRAL